MEIKLYKPSIATGNWINTYEEFNKNPYCFLYINGLLIAERKGMFFNNNSEIVSPENLSEIVRDELFRHSREEKPNHFIIKDIGERKVFYFKRENNDYSEMFMTLDYDAYNKVLITKGITS